MDEHFLFVYGKLRKGGELPMDENFPGVTFVGDATVNGRLYDLGRFPGLVMNNAQTHVLGAVYRLNDETLAKLDEIEASAEYYRQLKNALVGDETVTCWIYLPDPQQCTEGKFIASGDWIKHSTSRR